MFDDKPRPVIAPDYLMPNSLRQFSGAAAPAAAPGAMKMIPQRQYDPDKHLVYVGGKWVSHAGDFVVRFLSGGVASANKLNEEIVPWNRYDPLTNTISGLLGGQFPVNPTDHPVYIRLSNGAVVSPDRLSLKIADP